MEQLGEYLQRLRLQSDRSRRWVAKQSKTLYPTDPQRQISHSQLRQLEGGHQARPNPLKLRTLAEIYGADYRELMSMAGFLDAQDVGGEGATAGGPDATQPGGDRTELARARELLLFLAERGIRPLYFVQSLMALEEESLQIINRLITTLSVKERRARSTEAPAKERSTSVESG